MTTTPARLGLFGGTFNPIHVGHLRAAEEAAEALALDRVVFLPSAVPPHKASARGDVIAPAQHRLEWVKLATEGNPRFSVDALELEREGPSYSVDTLRTLRKRDGDAEIVFLIGLDAFAEIGSWREPEALFELTHFAVFPRSPRDPGTLADWIPDCVKGEIVLAPDGRSGRHARAGTWIRLLSIRPLDVSASELRERLREGRSVRYLVPDTVRRAILASGAYATREAH
jgi:nicotinate-nucleotide adenylyltransferase